MTDLQGTINLGLQLLLLHYPGLLVFEPFELTCMFFPVLYSLGIKSPASLGRLGFVPFSLIFCTWNFFLVPFSFNLKVYSQFKILVNT